MQRKSFLAASLITAAAAAHAEVVYSNTNNPSGGFFNSGNTLVGDELNLDGTSRELSSFSFRYYTVSLGGGEQARVSIYANDGTDYTPPGGVSPIKRPGTQLWTSDWFDVSLLGTQPATTTNTFLWSVANGNLPANIILPDRITFTVQFSGIDPGESAGVVLYNPATVGFSVPDYWEYDAVNDWRTKTNAVFAMDFGAQVQAVPEPSFWALAVTGGLCGFFLLRRRNS
jgi:hypothetical protein